MASRNTRGNGKWTAQEDEALRKGVAACGPRNWRAISDQYLKGQRTDVQCLHRWNKVSTTATAFHARCQPDWAAVIAFPGPRAVQVLRPGLVKGPWTSEEDEVIVLAIKEGVTRWSDIAARIPGRIGKQCRERWFNHLDPNLLKTPWTAEEDAILEQCHRRVGAFSAALFVAVCCAFTRQPGCTRLRAPWG